MSFQYCVLSILIFLYIYLPFYLTFCYSFIYPLIYLFIYTLINTFIYTFIFSLFTLLFIILFTRLFTLLFTLSFTLLSTLLFAVLHWHETPHALLTLNTSNADLSMHARRDAISMENFAPSCALSCSPRQEVGFTVSPYKTSKRMLVLNFQTYCHLPFISDINTVFIIAYWIIAITNHDGAVLLYGTQA